MDLSIIIVNWNSREYLRKCLYSILAEEHGFQFEIIVIDSASFDGCAEMLAKEYPQVRFIQSNENLGFAKSNNLASQSATGEWLLFLNPDTEVVGQAIAGLFQASRNLPDAGAVGCKLLNSDETLQTSCIQAFPTILNQALNAEALRRLTPKSRLWGIRALYRRDSNPAPVEMISGACLMMRRSVFERIGLFSTEYFMYAEDVDLCYKAKQVGLTNYYVGDATVIHHGGGSSQQARSYFADVMTIESNHRFLRKWHGTVYSRCYRITMSGTALVRVALLLALVPLLVPLKGIAKWKHACGKWLAIFRWGIGCSKWSSQCQINASSSSNNGRGVSCSSRTLYPNR